MTSHTYQTITWGPAIKYQWVTMSQLSYVFVHAAKTQMEGAGVGGGEERITPI